MPRFGKRKKRFGDYRPAERALLVGVVSASVVVVIVAERDIHRRPSDRVRGSKVLWRLVSTNALGAAAYLGWGRRR